MTTATAIEGEQLEAAGDRTSWPMLAALTLHPLMIPVLMLVGWDLAVTELGQEPVPYQHDPMSLGTTIRTLHVIWLVLLLAALPSFVVSSVRAYRRWKAPSGRSLMFLAPIMAWAIALIVMIWQGDVFTWFID